MRVIPRQQVRAGNEDAPDLREYRGQGNDLFRAGDYLRAIRIYESGYQEAKRRGLNQSAARFLNNLGGAYYQLFRHRDAIHAYLEARDLAVAQGDREAWGALCVNLSSLYFQMGDMDAALELANQGLGLPRIVTAKYRPQLLIQYARIKWWQKHSSEAAAILHEAIDASRARLDTASEAQAWNGLGNALLDDGNLEAAERALLEAYRLRKLTGDGRIYFDYQSLGNLRLLRGDPESAASFFDHALKSARSASPSAMWSIYYDRGRVRLTQMRLREAFTDFGRALEGLRRWRVEVLPADAFRVSTDVDAQQAYSSYIEAASRLYMQTGHRRFAEQAFVAAEESRAASLRILWAGSDLTGRLPSEYWEALAGLHKAEAAVVKGGPAVEAAAVRPRRLRVAEIEARAGLDFDSVSRAPDDAFGGALEQTRLALRPSEVYLGFHLGEAESYLWVIVREGFAVQRLPSRAHIAERTGAFVKALRERSAEVEGLSERIFSELFSSVRARWLAKPKWIVALDGPLFELPFAALREPPTNRGDAASYVVERHAIQVVPGSWALFGATAPDWNGPVVGLADPIYNRADPRLPRPLAPDASSSGRQSGSRTGIPRFELARLVGSSHEIENCAIVWRSHGYEPVLLRGADATRDNLARVLRRNPLVVHVAAHLLFPPEPSGPGLLALTRTASQDVELLSTTEIASMRFKLGVVVLNGCSSARAAVLPGAGLVGMTRAWLAAGARAVIVTRWSTSDQDEGKLFESFYQRFSTAGNSPQRTFAELLQQAQLTELRAGGRRANPWHWAAYFCVGRN